MRRPAELKQPTFSWIHRVYAWCKAEIPARARLALWTSLYPLILISVKPGPTLGGEVSSQAPARTAPPKPPSLGNPAVEGRDWDSTHRRISCLVRNVRS